MAAPEVTSVTLSPHRPDAPANAVRRPWRNGPPAGVVVRRSLYDCRQVPLDARWGNGMAKLVYITNVSLDGYIEDGHGRFDWTEPSEEVFAFITDLVRPFGTYLFGRRLYETMAVWETDPALAARRS